MRHLRAPFAIEFHDENKHGFDQDENDDAWLSVVNEKSWVVISHDKRFHQDSAAIEAVRQHAGRVFYLDGGSSVKWDKLRRFVSSYRRIRKIIEEQEAPYIYRIAYNDRIFRQRDFNG